MAKWNSILQDDPNECFLCGRNGCGDPLDKHHIFGGPNRKLSDKYGLYVRLCHSRCHEHGKDAVHNNKDVRLKLQAKAQEAFVDNYSGLDFLSLFGRNYIL